MAAFLLFMLSTMLLATSAGANGLTLADTSVAHVPIIRRGQEPPAADVSGILIGEQRREIQPVATHTSLPTYTSTHYSRQDGMEGSHGEICLVVIIAAAGASIVSLIAVSLALLCAGRWFGKCRRCTTDMASAVEDQKWPRSRSRITYEGYCPWLLGTKQPEQSQAPQLHREQSWSSNTTAGNNHQNNNTHISNTLHEVVSPLESQSWDQIQQNYQVSPTASDLSPVIQIPIENRPVVPQRRLPVELPASPSTPLPSYPATMADAHLPPRFSWTGEEESSYRPSSWTKQ